MKDSTGLFLGCALFAGILAALIIGRVSAQTPIQATSQANPAFTFDATTWTTNSTQYLAVFSIAGDPQIEMLQLVPGTNWNATNFAIETWATPVIKWWSNGVWRIEFKP